MTSQLRMEAASIILSSVAYSRVCVQCGRPLFKDEGEGSVPCVSEEMLRQERVLWLGRIAYPRRYYMALSANIEQAWRDAA